MTVQLIDQLNKQPVNQLAKRLLRQAKQKPDPDLLYLYQLPKWALENGEVKNQEAGSPHANEDLLGAVERLLLLNPQKAMDFLLREGPEEGSPWVKPVLLAKLKKPADAAAYLLDRMKAALAENEPNPNLE